MWECSCEGWMKVREGGNESKGGGESTWMYRCVRWSTGEWCG